MLSHLSIRNYTLVDQLDIHFEAGTTAITGETGAGKSIMLDALSLTLGDRADFSRIRQGQDKAEVCAMFDASANQLASQWLEQNELEQDGDCILRRVINRNGKSSAWVNGRPVTLVQLRDLAELLISIHSQHEHQKLVRPAYQVQLLDEYGELLELRAGVQNAWHAWQEQVQQLETLQRDMQQNRQRQEELQQVVEDLDALDLQPGEFEALEAEQAELANAESIIATLQQLVNLLREDENFSLDSGVRRSIELLESLPGQSKQLEESLDMLRSAAIQLDEAGSLIRHEAERIELNPQRLSQVEQRLGDIFSAARKYRLNQSELQSFHHKQQEALQQIADPEGALEQAQQECQALRSVYTELAQQLSSGRTNAATALSDEVNGHFDGLAMKGAAVQFLMQTDPEQFAGPGGIDRVELHVRTNPGQDFGPMAKIASGGELSRISLAIQMVTARQGQMPCLVFDEVDVGIGGATAERVGKLLRKLGERAQVICITHLAQVAAFANQQLWVRKEDDENSVRSYIDPLSEDERVKEIARMLRGSELTDAALANARELLGQADA